MFMLKRPPAQIQAPSAPVQRASQEVPSHLKPLVLTVEETWEAPDPAQYENALQDHMAALLEPLDEQERSIEEKRVLFRRTVERMVEIAPDLFEKALARSAFETGYFIGGGNDGPDKTS